MTNRLRPPGDTARALSESDGFQLLAHALPDAVLAVGPSGEVLYASDQADGLFDSPATDLIGRLFADLIDPADRSVFPPAFADPSAGAWDVRPAHAPDLWLNVATLPLGDGPATPLHRTLGETSLVLIRSVPESPTVARDRVDLLRHALNATNILVVVSDARAPDNPLVFVNGHFSEVTGYPRAEVIGRNCRFLQTRGDGSRDDDQDGVLEIRRAVAAGEPAHVTIRNYRKSGELFYNELYLTPIRDRRGEVVNYVGVQNDVTDRVLAQREVQSQAGLLRAFYDSAPMLMGVVEQVDGRLVHRTANVRSAEVYRRAPEEVTGASPDELGFTPDEARRWADAVEACHRAGEPIQFNTTIPWDNEEGTPGTRSLRMTVSRVQDTAGPAPLYAYVGEDVTEARRAARERQLLAAAVDQAAESILVTDAETEAPGPRILYANQGHERLFGYSHDEVVGRSPRMFQGPATDQAVLDRVRRRLRAGQEVSAETINYRKDGSEFVLQWEIAPVTDDRGEIVNWVGTQRDVTDRRRLEHEVLEAAGREQERIARELHDGLGQVLTGSAMQLHVVERELAAQGDAALADDVVRIRGHIRDALEQARAIARGLFPVEIDPDGLAPALERLCVEAGQSFGVECHFESDGAVTVASSEAAGHLYRVVQEAATNAVRHGRAARIDVDLSLDGDDAVLTVRDDGAGIEDDALGGGGLGLRTMAYRARRVGGTLKVQPGDGGGTVVRLRFPQA